MKFNLECEVEVGSAFIRLGKREVFLKLRGDAHNPLREITNRPDFSETIYSLGRTRLAFTRYN